MTSAAIDLIRDTPGLAIRPDPEGLRATLVAATTLDSSVVARAAAALREDRDTRDLLVRGIQRWRSIMARLRADHGRAVEECVHLPAPSRTPGWYIAMHEDLVAVEAVLRDRFAVKFCLSGPVEHQSALLMNVDCSEPAPDGRFDYRLACEYCNAEYYEGLRRQSFGY